MWVTRVKADIVEEMGSRLGYDPQQHREYGMEWLFAYDACLITVRGCLVKAEDQSIVKEVQTLKWVERERGAGDETHDAVVAWIKEHAIAETMIDG